MADPCTVEADGRLLVEVDLLFIKPLSEDQIRQEMERIR